MKSLFVSAAKLSLFALLASLILSPAGGGGEQKQPAAVLPSEYVKSLTWRSVGPANMGGRITAVAVYEADPTCYYVSTASGGLLKTVDNGKTFQHQFDQETTVSIGDVCVAQTDKNIVWVGTGEANPRNSVTYGDGVYKSIDGGKTWKHMGLKETFQIGKIVIHPKNPDIVYVGALGRLYGNNPERGLYKTSDGGKTWNKLFYLDDRTGAVDIIMHPNDPDTLIVSMWERRRDGFDSYVGGDMPAPGHADDPVVRFGPNSGMYKTTDGGKTFAKITKGLPTSQLGRIGMDWYRKDANIVYAIVDCEDLGAKGPLSKEKARGLARTGFSAEDSDDGVRVTKVEANSSASKAGLKVDDILVALDKNELKTVAAFSAQLVKGMAGSKVALTIKRDDDMKDVVLTLPRPSLGGGGATRPYEAYIGGQRANIQDPQGPEKNEYGGVYRSEDGGETWQRVNSLNPRPFYFSTIRVDPSDDQNVYVLGISQHRSANGGKTFTADLGGGVHPDCHALWIDPNDGKHMIIGSDGGHYGTTNRGQRWERYNTVAIGQYYHVAVCTKKPYWLYGGLQDNGSFGIPSLSLQADGPINQEVININGGDGYVCRVDPSDPDIVYAESPHGAIVRRNLKTKSSTAVRPKAVQGKSFHFNWNTPYILSHQNPKIFYVAGNYVFKSLERGDNLKIISPDITRSKRGTASALSESPKNPEVLWVGTDDGNLWITRNGGSEWTEISQRVPLPVPSCVATLEASRYKEGRCYACFDAHRSNDDKPYIFVTEDFGQTWTPLSATLPAFGSTRCLREDVENENLLYCGTEFAMFASIDRGAQWAKINNNLPTVAIHEIAVHPSAGEIAVATHGRSLWILDVTALRQTTPQTLAKNVHLYKPGHAILWQRRMTDAQAKARFVGTNPPSGAQIYYTLGKNADKVTVKIFDANGEKVAEMVGPNRAGLGRVLWNVAPPQDEPKDAGQNGARGTVTPGIYRVVLHVDGQEFTTNVRIDADPNVQRKDSDTNK